MLESIQARTGLRSGLLLALILGVLVLAGLGGIAYARFAGAGTSAPATGGPAAAAPAGPAGTAQVSEGGQVTVAVTWQGRSAGLSFAVMLDTHSVELDGYDLRELAVLRTDQGVEVAPSGWDAPPGGHHRKGTLTFPTTTAAGQPVFTATTRELVLVIRDVAGVPERSFRWQP